MNTRFRTAGLMAALAALLAMPVALADTGDDVTKKMRGAAAGFAQSRQAAPRPERAEQRREPSPRQSQHGQRNHEQRQQAPREQHVARNPEAPARPPREGSRQKWAPPQREVAKPEPGRQGDRQVRWNDNRGKDDRDHGRGDHNRGDHNRHDYNRDGHKRGPDYRHVDKRRTIVYRSPRVVPRLPVGHRHYTWNGHAYYHHGGHWYRPWGASYAVVGAPYGLFVSYLPSYHTSFWFGGMRYFHADSTYYLYEPARHGYVVARSPYGDGPDGDEAEPEDQDEDLYVYPAQGQSEQQQADDRYECHRWSVQESGYDPIDSDYDADMRAGYLRALTACLTGRGYSVR